MLGVAGTVPANVPNNRVEGVAAADTIALVPEGGEVSSAGGATLRGGEVHDLGRLIETEDGGEEVCRDWSGGEEGTIV